MCHRVTTTLFILCLAMMSFVACSSSPKLIAAQPVDSSAGSSQQTAYFITVIDMEVWDIQSAIDQIIPLVNDQGGYLDDLKRKELAARSYARLEFTIPNDRINFVIRELEKSGNPINSKGFYDQLILEVEKHPTGFSHLMIYLHQKSRWEPNTNSFGWNPVRTLQRAWVVSNGIFRFLLDVFIWIIVVTGPFFLVGWLIYMGVKRYKR
jgi:hypothetical protein